MTPNEEPVEQVVADTVTGHEDRTTRREAVELELEDQDRSEDGEDVVVDEVVPPDSPAAGVVDPHRADPPEPSEPG
jgi:hypothetical protein